MQSHAILCNIKRKININQPELDNWVVYHGISSNFGGSLLKPTISLASLASPDLGVGHACPLSALTGLTLQVYIKGMSRMA